MDEKINDELDRMQLKQLLNNTVNRTDGDGSINNNLLSQIINNIRIL